MDAVPATIPPRDLARALPLLTIPADIGDMMAHRLEAIAEDLFAQHDAHVAARALHDRQVQRMLADLNRSVSLYRAGWIGVDAVRAAVGLDPLPSAVEGRA